MPKRESIEPSGKPIILDRTLHVNPYTPEGKKEFDAIVRETLEALGEPIPESLQEEEEGSIEGLSDAIGDLEDSLGEEDEKK